MKSLRCLAEFLHFLGTVQTELESHQKEFSRACSNPNDLYRQLARNRTAGVSKDDLRFFLDSFGYSLQEPSIQGSNYRILRKESRKEELLSQALDLLLKDHSTQGIMTFADFSWLAMGNHDSMVYRPGEATYGGKEALFNLLQTELQNLLIVQAFKRTIMEEVPKIDEAFAVVCKKGNLTAEAITTLLNVNGIFPSFPVERIVSRLKGEISLPEFKKFIALRASPKQAKIFHSNIRKTALNESNISFGTFGTPNKRTFVTQASTGRKVPLVLSEIKVKEFNEQLKPANPLSALQQIAAHEKQFERKKQTMLLNPDLDFELLYDQLAEEFVPLLKKLYKDASFTSFLRFILPAHTWQHQYLGFIRYNANNRITADSIERVRSLLRDHEEKERKIEAIWKLTESEGQARPQLFKSISSDAHSIHKHDLLKHFPEQSVRLLLERMDRLRAGHISLERFC